MLQVVSRDRLDRPYFNGQFQRAALSKDDFKAARAATLSALGLGLLGVHL